MRKLLFLALILASTLTFSQSPQKINYQAIARDGSGNIVTTLIGIKFEIIQGSPGGTVVFAETNSTMPSSAGIFTTHIGSGSALIGTFTSINWANSPHFIRVSIDPAGGTSYNVVGTSELVSVPYALYAETAGNTQSLTPGNGITINSGTITNSAPNQTVNISGSAVTGSYPNYTITSPGAPTASTGISISGGTITNTAPDQTITISGATGTYPNFTITPQPSTTITPGNSNITVSGADPNFTISAVPTLSLSGAQLSISNGNTVTLPTGTTYTNGAGIALTSGTIITNTAPNQTVNLSGSGVTGTYPNYTVTSAPSTSVSSGSSNVIITGSVPSYSVIVLNPVIAGIGTSTVTNAGNNYTVNTPPVNMTFLPATGILSYSPSSGSNTINIIPAVSFTNNILSVGSTTTSIPGTGLWSKLGGATYLSNTSDFVGIGTTNPAQNLHVQGVNAYIRVQSTQSTTAANSIIEFGNTIASVFNSKGSVGNPGSGDHMEYEALTFHRFTTQGTERMRITNTGSVGVGNFSPFSLFDVNGKITMRTGASTGFIPVSDGNGTMTWTNPTSVIPSLWAVTGNSLYPTTISNSVGIGTPSPMAKLHVTDVVSTGASMFVTNTIASGVSGSAAKFDNTGVRSVGNSGVIVNNLVTKVGGNNSTKIGLEVNSTGAWGVATVNQPNVGIKATASGADNNYALQLVDGSEGDGKILTSDASGNASWSNSPPAKVYGGLNNTPVTVTSGGNAMGTPVMTFTKQFNYSEIHLDLHTLATSGTFAGGATYISFELRIDNIPSTISTVHYIFSTNTTEYIDLKAVFIGLTPGPHTVTIWGKTNAGNTSSIYLDPGGWGGKLILKEVN